MPELPFSLAIIFRGALAKICACRKSIMPVCGRGTDSLMMKINGKNKGRILLVLTALCWGLAGVCVKSVTWNPMAVISFRSIISLVMLFIVKRSIKIKFNKTNMLAAVFTAVTGILYITAITLTTAGTAIVLQYVAPVFVFLFAVFFRKRKVKVSETVLILAVFAGIVLSFADSLDFTHLLGNMLALASGATFAAQIIIMNGKDTDNEDSLIISNGLCFFAGLPFVFTGEGVVFDWKNILWLLILAVVQYGLANILFSKSIQKVDSVEGSLILTLEPVVNPVYVAIFCEERMGALAIAGAVIVIVAVVVFTLLPAIEKRRLKHSNE